MLTGRLPDKALRRNFKHGQKCLPGLISKQRKTNSKDVFVLFRRRHGPTRGPRRGWVNGEKPVPGVSGGRHLSEEPLWPKKPLPWHILAISYTSHKASVQSWVFLALQATRSQLQLLSSALWGQNQPSTRQNWTGLDMFQWNFIYKNYVCRIWLRDRGWQTVIRDQKSAPIHISWFFF